MWRGSTVFSLFSSSLISILWQIVMMTTERRGVIRYPMPSGYPNPEAALCGCRQNRVWKIPIENSTKAKMIDWLWGADWADQSIMVYSSYFHGIRPYLFLWPFLLQMEETLRGPLKMGVIGVPYCIYKDWSTFTRTDIHHNTISFAFSCILLPSLMYFTYLMRSWKQTVHTAQALFRNQSCLS